MRPPPVRFMARRALRSRPSAWASASSGVMDPAILTRNDDRSETIGIGHAFFEQPGACGRGPHTQAGNLRVEPQILRLQQRNRMVERLPTYDRVEQRPQRLAPRDPFAPQPAYLCKREHLQPLAFRTTGLHGARGGGM